MKVAIRAGLVVVALVTSGVAAERKVTFDCPGESLGVLVKELATKVGQPLAVSQELSAEVVVLRVHDVTAGQVLQRIASTVDATWQSKGGRQVLTRTSAQDRAQREAEHKADVEAIQRALDGLEANVAKEPKFDEAEASALAQRMSQPRQRDQVPTRMSPRFENQRQTPIGRGLDRAMLLIPAEELADQPSGIRVVYSNTPTKLQRQLPDQVMDLVHEIVAEQAIWAQAAQAGNAVQPIQTPGLPPGIRFGANLDRKPFDAVPNRVFLAVTRDAQGRGLDCEMILTGGPVGEVLEQSQSTVIQVEAAPRPESAPGSTPLSLPPDLQEFVQAAKTHQSSLSPELRARLLNPSKQEPLSVLIGSTLVAAAQAKNENLVGLVSDRFANLFGWFDAKSTVESFLQTVRTVGEVSEADGWMTVRPRTPAADRDHAADREQLGEYLAKIDHEFMLSIEDQAHWAIELPSASANLIPRLYGMTLFGTARTASQDEYLLRLYGGLSAKQREAALTKEGLPLSDLDSVSTDALNHIVFGPAHSMTTSFSLRPSDVVGPRSGLFLEPTEYLAAGVPAGARLHLTQSGGFGVVPMDGLMRRISNARALASTVNQYMFNSNGTSTPVPMPKTFLAGMTRTLAFRIELTQDLAIAPGSLTDIRVGSQSVVSFDDLPQDFRDEVTKEMDVIKSRSSRFPRSSSTPPPG